MIMHLIEYQVSDNHNYGVANCIKRKIFEEQSWQVEVLFELRLQNRLLSDEIFPIFHKHKLKSNETNFRPCFQPKFTRFIAQDRHVFFQRVKQGRDADTSSHLSQRMSKSITYSSRTKLCITSFEGRMCCLCLNQPKNF